MRSFGLLAMTMVGGRHCGRMDPPRLRSLAPGLPSSSRRHSRRGIGPPDWGGEVSSSIVDVRAPLICDRQWRPVAGPPP